MNEINIRKYAELMKELDLTGLEITEDNRVVRLERNTAGTDNMVAGPVYYTASVHGNSEVESASGIGNSGVQGIIRGSDTVQEGNTNSSENMSADEYISVKSPMVGVFYDSPAEDADAFVSVGNRVEAGKTLCIIEAMKLMNEIHAEESGVISEVCVANGQIVEYGTELFRIRR